MIFLDQDDGEQPDVVTYAQMVKAEQSKKPKPSRDDVRHFRKKANKIHRALKKKYLSLAPDHHYVEFFTHDDELRFVIAFGVRLDSKASGMKVKMAKAMFEATLEVVTPMRRRELKKMGLDTQPVKDGVTYLQDRIAILSGRMHQVGTDSKIEYEEIYLDNMNDFIDGVFVNLQTSGFIGNAGKADWDAAAHESAWDRLVAQHESKPLPKMDGKKSARVKYIVNAFERRLRKAARPYFNDVAFRFSMQDPRISLTFYPNQDYVGLPDIDMLRSSEPKTLNGTSQIHAGDTGSEARISVYFSDPQDPQEIVTFNIAKPENTSKLFRQVSGVDPAIVRNFMDQPKLPTRVRGKKRLANRAERRRATIQISSATPLQP